MKPKHENRALVNGVPCVRVNIREYTPCMSWDNICGHCPLTRKIDSLCDSSCGNHFIWVDLVHWVTLKLEA